LLARLTPAGHSCDGLVGSQHLDTPVRTQDLTGHPGHQRLFTIPDVSRETSNPNASFFPLASNG
jgi:hypothetical protein